VSGLWPRPTWVLLMTIAITIGFGYDAASSLFERTVITVSTEAIAVRHRPLPARGNGTIAITDVKTLDVRTVGRRPKKHDVVAVLVDRSKRVVVGNIANADRARFIRDWLAEQTRRG